MKLLTRREVEERTGLKRSTIYDNVKSGVFPKPVKIGVKLIRWPEEVIENWLQAQMFKRDSLVGWQPIATCPKESGKEYLVVSKGRQQVASWTHPYGKHVNMDWWMEDEDGSLYPVRTPTHWMPLPPNPLETK